MVHFEIVTEMLSNPITYNQYKWLLTTRLSIPWTMRARLINKYRKEQR